jgi:hypothetical protein
MMQSDQITYLGFSDTITHVTVNAEFAPGKYTIESKSNKKINMLHFSFKGNRYNTTITEDGLNGVLNLIPKEYDNLQSSGKISLYEDLNYIFNLQGENSDVTLHAENLKIDTLHIAANKSSTWQISLSKLVSKTYVIIKSHPDAKNIELTIPASSGYQFTTSVISDEKQWNNLQPTETGAYQSENFNRANTLIFIECQ